MEDIEGEERDGEDGHPQSLQERRYRRRHYPASRPEEMRTITRYPQDLADRTIGPDYFLFSLCDRVQRQ